MRLCYLNKEKLLDFRFVYRSSNVLVKDSNNNVIDAEKALMGYLNAEINKIASRYAKKMVNPKYFLKINIAGDNYI